MIKYSRLFFTCTFVAIAFHAQAQEKYHLSNIPAELLVNANAVIRSSATEVIIKNEGRAIINETIAITILNEAGNERSSMVVHYDKFNSIQSFTGKLFNASGVVIKSLKRGDIKDLSGTSSSNLADDVRLKLHDFNYQVYPYTIEYETSVEVNGLFFLPSWIPIEDENISVQQSSLTVTTPLPYSLRYKAFNYKGEPSTSSEKEMKTYGWKIANLPAINFESYSIPWHETTTSVFLAPTTFEIADYKGSMDNWKEMGKFIYSLNNGKDRLPENIRAKVYSLTGHLSNINEKIKVLYAYMQQNTRYVSIQLGLGGWQPFDASSVAINGYGDCKALSNYMFSLLKEAKIKSFYTLIRAGEKNESIINDFPSQQFNHVILCVPQKEDTLWLECTSQTLPAGYLGSFTSNRNALLISEEGGTLVRTPKYSKVENVQVRSVLSTLDLNGNLSMDINTLYQAEQQDDVHSLLHSQSKESISEYLKEKLSIPSYDVQSFKYTPGNSGILSINENLKVFAHNFATVSGKRIFITANILNRSGIKLPDQVKRKNALRVSLEYIDIDSIEMNIPDGYVSESTPDNISLSTKFGIYTSTFTVIPGKIKYVRRLERYSGLYPAADGVAFAHFYKEIYRADRQRFVLVKKDQVAAAN